MLELPRVTSKRKLGLRICGDLLVTILRHANFGSPPFCRETSSVDDHRLWILSPGVGVLPLLA